MKTICLNGETLEQTFEQIKKQVGGTVSKTSNECVLKFNNNYGAGSIQGVLLPGDISYLELDLNFFDDVSFEAKTSLANVIHFGYCLQGSVKHSFGIQEKVNELKSFQTGIFMSQRHPEHVLVIPKSERFRMVLITVPTDTYDKDAVSTALKVKLFNTFQKDGTCKDFVYIGSQNLKIAEKINQIHAIKENGLVRTLLVQGLINVILALEIQQHVDDLEQQREKSGLLTTSEMLTIKSISEYIEINFDQSLTISFLCSEFGISAFKLQEGFKAMHDRTVSNHITWVRVQKAEDYLRNTDMNVSEIVYSIGFSSRSYFSKIFKEYYNCSPREYKEAQKILPLSA